jgi:hypothetical protein
MSRLSPGGDIILVKPTSNVYTVLAVVGMIAEILAMVYLWMMHTKLFEMPLLPG